MVSDDDWRLTAAGIVADCQQLSANLSSKYIIVDLELHRAGFLKKIGLVNNIIVFFLTTAFVIGVINRFLLRHVIDVIRIFAGVFSC